MVFKVKEALELNKEELFVNYSKYKDICLHNQNLVIDTIGDELHSLLVDNCIVETLSLFDDKGNFQGIGFYDFALGELVVSYGTGDSLSYVIKISTDQQLLSIVQGVNNILKIRGLSNR